MRKIDKSSKIYVAGHNGLVGGAVVRSLADKGYDSVLTRSRSELNLRDQRSVREFLRTEQPDVVIVAAAKVGGIYANNTFKSDFILQNLQIQTNLIGEALEADVPHLIFLGSTCIYPRNGPQPLKETDLLTGPLEESNRPYAIAKIAGLELTASIRMQHQKNYYSLMPTNLYGPGDNFHPEHAHVLPALIRRFVEAKESQSREIIVWGSGTPLREFLYIGDCADAITFLMEKVDLDTFKQTEIGRMGWSHINLGSNSEVSIRDLAYMIKEIVGYEGEIQFDRSKLDGTPRKLSDTKLLTQLGWMPKTSLLEGLKKTVSWYLEHKHQARL